jgi:hypothetical protein
VINRNPKRDAVAGRARPFGLGGGACQKEQIPLRFARRNDKWFGKNSGEIIGDGTERFPVFRRMEIGERRECPVRPRFLSRPSLSQLYKQNLALTLSALDRPR